MAEKVLRTKIALLYKTAAEWEAAEDYKPIKGEVCICASNANPAEILFKVGDDVHTFAELNWASALASDVYAWAKKENLDFGDLDANFMAALDAEILEQAGTLSTDFRIVETEEDSHVWKLQKSIAGGDWVDASEFRINPDVFAKVEYVDAQIEAERNARIAGDNLKVDKEINGANGKARIFNEADGGGAKFEHNDGSEAFIGVNDGGKDGLMAQIYADVLKDGKWSGAKIDVTNDGMYYTVGDKSFAERAVEENEIATVGNVADAKAAVEAEIAALDGSLADIAKTGNVNDLIQDDGDILVLNCNL